MLRNGPHDDELQILLRLHLAQTSQKFCVQLKFSFHIALDYLQIPDELQDLEKCVLYGFVGALLPVTWPCTYNRFRSRRPNHFYTSRQKSLLCHNF